MPATGVPNKCGPEKTQTKQRHKKIPYRQEWADAAPGSPCAERRPLTLLWREADFVFKLNLNVIRQEPSVPLTESLVLSTTDKNKHVFI